MGGMSALRGPADPHVAAARSLDLAWSTHRFKRAPMDGRPTIYVAGAPVTWDGVDLQNAG